MASQYKLKMTDETRELIRHLHPAMKQKVRVALTEILENPGCGEALRGELQGLRSFWVSKFRIIYRAVAQVIEVVALGPRRSIYEETLRLLQVEGSSNGSLSQISPRLCRHWRIRAGILDWQQAPGCSTGSLP